MLLAEDKNCRYMQANVENLMLPKRDLSTGHSNGQNAITWRFQLYADFALHVNIRFLIHSRRQTKNADIAWSKEVCIIEP